MRIYAVKDTEPKLVQRSSPLRAKLFLSESVQLCCVSRLLPRQPFGYSILRQLLSYPDDSSDLDLQILAKSSHLQIDMLKLCLRSNSLRSMLERLSRHRLERFEKPRSRAMEINFQIYVDLNHRTGPWESPRWSSTPAAPSFFYCKYLQMPKEKEAGSLVAKVVAAWNSLPCCVTWGDGAANNCIWTWSGSVESTWPQNEPALIHTSVSMPLHNCWTALRLRQSGTITETYSDMQWLVVCRHGVNYHRIWYKYNHTSMPCQAPILSRLEWLYNVCPYMYLFWQIKCHMNSYK